MVSCGPLPSFPFSVAVAWIFSALLTPLRFFFSYVRLSAPSGLLFFPLFVSPSLLFLSCPFELRIRPSHHHNIIPSSLCLSIPGPAECAKRLNNSLNDLIILYVNYLNPPAPLGHTAVGIGSDLQVPWSSSPQVLKSSCLPSPTILQVSKSPHLSVTDLLLVDRRARDWDQISLKAWFFF